MWRVSEDLGVGGVCFFFQAEDGIRDRLVTGVQTCALPISVYGSCCLFFKVNFPGGSLGTSIFYCIPSSIPPPLYKLR